MVVVGPVMLTISLDQHGNMAGRAGRGSQHHSPSSAVALAELTGLDCSALPLNTNQQTSASICCQLLLLLLGLLVLLVMLL